jgi:hypothetical protein
MEFPRGTARARLLRRSIALISAAALLLGQLAASVHTHASYAGERAGAVAQLSAGDVLCPLCLLASHSRPKPSAAPTLRHPEVSSELAAYTAAGFVDSLVFARAMTRAPPALA